MTNAAVGLIKTIEGAPGIECHLADVGHVQQMVTFISARAMDAGHSLQEFVKGMREQANGEAVHYVIRAHKPKCIQGGGEQVMLEISAYSIEPDPDPATFREGLLGTFMQSLHQPINQV